LVVEGSVVEGFLGANSCALTLLGESNEPATLLGRGPIDLDIASLHR